MKTKQTKKYKIITIFGLTGTGTSTCGKILAQKLNYDFLSTGNLIRKMAQERNMSLNEPEEEMKEDTKIDIEFDKK